MEAVSPTCSEAQVESDVVLPLLRDPELLGIASGKIKSKEYLAPTALDKKAGKHVGYYPDFAIVDKSIAVGIVEAKAPSVDAEVGYREGCLYALHLNRSYPPGVNPVQRVLATNGLRVLAGNWDSDPEFDSPVSDIFPGSLALQKLRSIFSGPVFDDLLGRIAPKLLARRVYLPYHEANCSDALNAKMSPNTFAAPLAPALKKYLTSRIQNNDSDIYDFAYVNDKQLSSYDNTLDSLMREKIVELRGSLNENLDLTAKDERHIKGAIQRFHDDHPSGELQIITGAVGTGKSLFVRRYKELLQNPSLSEVCHWAFIDFNSAPLDLAGAETWLAEKFVESFSREKIGSIHTRSKIKTIYWLMS